MGTTLAQAGRTTEDLERFAGMLAHELRNPLASAATNLAVAVELIDEDDPRRSFIERAGAEMERIGSLLDACLALATAGRVRARPADFASLLERAATAARERRPGARIRAECERPLTGPADSVLLERALANLLENALRAGGPEIEILLTGRRIDGCVELTIEDSGPGLPPELAERVFEPFVTTGLEGTGLGLAFVKKVAEAHGGRVSTCASRLGGAGFRLWIPCEEGV